MTLRDALSPTGDYVLFQGERVHVNDGVSVFYFPPICSDLPLGQLIRRERARISMAHSLLQPAYLLLLDEPTNDLDVATLETLEESFDRISRCCCFDYARQMHVGPHLYNLSCFR